MKKMLSKKIISLFVCVALAVCVLPMAAFAENSKADSKTAASQNQQTSDKADKKEEEKENKKIEISLGDAYKKVYDGKEVSKSDVYSLVSTKSGGVTVFTYKWYDANGNLIDYNPVNAGVYKLKIQVSEKDPSYTGSATVSYIIEQRPLEWDVSQLKISKPYDGTTDAASVEGKLLLSGIVEGDEVSLSYDSITAAAFSTPDVQRVSVGLTVGNAAITGTDAPNYSLPKIQPAAEAAIIKAYITEITIPDDSNKYRLVVEEAVYVTDDLAAAAMDTEEGIKSALRAKVAETFADKEEYSAVYCTPVLQVLKNDEWVDVSEAEMPQENLTITLQYPESTDSKTHEFVIYKLKTTGDEAGIIEVWAHTEKVDGLEITLSQGDTFAVGYTPESQSNITMIIIIGAVAVMIIAGVVFFKLHKSDREEAVQEADQAEQ